MILEMVRDITLYELWTKGKLNTRAYNGLKDKFTHLIHLQNLTTRDLSMTDGLGPTSIEHIEKLLAFYGLKLKSVSLEDMKETISIDPIISSTPYIYSDKLDYTTPFESKSPTYLKLHCGDTVARTSTDIVLYNAATQLFRALALDSINSWVYSIKQHILYVSPDGASENNHLRIVCSYEELLTIYKIIRGDQL